jgi:acyl-CoA synthetase (NDP forming)
VGKARDAAGTWLLRNLVENGYEGAVFGVNPKYDSLHGTVCYPSVEALPEAVDCALIAVSPSDTEIAIEQCAIKGVRSALIFSSGFGETGEPDDILRQQRITQIALDAKMPVSGPNLLGLMNFVDHTFQTIYADAGLLPSDPGNLAVIAQSGGLGFNLAHRRARGLNVSYLLTAGNSCDVDVVDYLNFAIEDHATDAIVLVLEGVADGRSLVEVGRRALRVGKPIIVHKLGKSAAGTRAALSHTGTIAGSSRTYSTAFREAGMIEAEYEDLLNVAQLFVRNPKPSGHGVGVLSTSGGGAIMAADAAAAHGVSLPEPSIETREHLLEEVPGFGVVGNPSDLTSATIRNPELFGRAVGAFASDPNFAAIVVPVMVSYGETTARRPAMVVDAAAKSRKPTCAVWMSSWLDGPGVEVLETSPDIALFRSLNDCFAAIASWLKWNERMDAEAASVAHLPPSPIGTGLRVPTGESQPGGGTVRRPLSEVQSMKVLKTAGIGFARGRLVRSRDEARVAADELGPALVLKAASPQIPHKAQAGCVRLGVPAESVEAEFDDLLNTARSIPDADVHGILIQEVVPAGLELFVGARRDPQFGPVVACGVGGVDVETINDTSLALAPVDARRAAEMVTELARVPEAAFDDPPSAGTGLAGFVDLVVRVSELMVSDDTIVEIDLNPIIVRSGCAPVAVDALVVTDV